ncbi:MAG: DMT family transporter [Cohaesibacter sp.]|nr:DMT family transporter [Cohaesibacter sp.]MCV6603063.1 DMT family transporter [Cohaesibacter sp.]
MIKPLASDKPTQTLQKPTLLWVFGMIAAIIVLYAISWVWSAELLQDVAPLWSSAIRLGASFIGIVFFNLIRGHSGFKKLFGDANPRHLSLLAITGFSGFFALSYVALTSISATLLVLILSSIPVLTFLQSVLYFRQAATLFSICGTICTLLAIILFAHSSGVEADLSSGKDHILLPWGILFALFAAVSYAFYGLSYKRLLSHYSVTDILPGLLGIGTVFSAITALLIEGVPSGFSVSLIGQLLVIGAIIAAPVYVMYNLLIVRTDPLIASTISILAPVSTFIIEQAVRGHSLIGHSIDPGHFAALAISAIGLLLLFLSNKYQGKSHET